MKKQNAKAQLLLTTEALTLATQKGEGGREGRLHLCRICLLQLPRPFWRAQLATLATSCTRFLIFMHAQTHFLLQTTQQAGDFWYMNPHSYLCHQCTVRLSNKLCSGSLLHMPTDRIFFQAKIHTELSQETKFNFLVFYHLNSPTQLCISMPIASYAARSKQ